MPIDVTFTAVGGEEPDKSLRALFKDSIPTAADMLRAGTNEMQRIVDRTGRGVDVRGAAFAPYAPSYAKVREKAGLQTDPVNLRVSGELLDTMSVQIRSEISFAIVIAPDYSEIAQALNEGVLEHNLPTREFFATSDEDLNRMMADLFSGGNKA